jgi:hypothetical protein
MNRIFIFYFIFMMGILARAFAQTDSLNINWNPNPEPDMLQYKLYRSVNAFSNFQLINTVNHPNTHVVDKANISPGNLYAYTLVAVDSAGNQSEFSDTVSVGLPQVDWTVSEIPADVTSRIALSDFLTDQDNSVGDLTVTFSGESHLQISQSNDSLVLTPQASYLGSAGFHIKAEDPNGFWDQADIQVDVIQEVPHVFTIQVPSIDFPEDSQFELSLDTCINVSPFSPEEITWQITDLNHLSRQINASNRLVTFASNQVNWFGKDTVTFVATAPNSETKSQSVVITVDPVNDPPIAEITELFTGALSNNIFDLKQYASDVDDDPGDLNWQFVGYSHFNITWENQSSRMIKIINLDGETQESGRFIVSDAAGSKDTAQVMIHYNPNTVNSPPLLQNVNAQLKFAEDSLLVLQINTMVIDSTNTFGELSFEFTPGEHLEYQYHQSSAKLEIFADPDWCGESEFKIKATDPGNLSDENTYQVVVSPRADLQDLSFVKMNDQNIEVKVSLDVPSKITMTYWLNSSFSSTYHSPNFALKHAFYLSNIQADTTYSFELSLQDTSGYSTTLMDSVFNTATATTAGSQIAEDIIVYPNPFRLSKGHEVVIFDHLPVETQGIDIYTPAGEPVFEHHTDGAESRWRWQVVNNDNRQLASGLYIYVIKGKGGKKLKSGKLAVIR